MEAPGGKLSALALVTLSLLTTGMAQLPGPAPTVDHPCPDGPNTQRAATPGCTAWTNHVDAENARGFEHVATAASGDLVVAAGSLTPIDGQARDLTVAAFSAETGENVWTYRFDEVAEGSAYVNDLVVGPEANTVYAVGIATEAFVETDDLRLNHYEAVAVALDAHDGTPEWTQTFSREGPPQVSGDGFWGVGLGSNGDRLVAVGASEDSEDRNEPLAVGYEADTGQEAWRILGDARNGTLTDVEAGPQGQLVAAGFDEAYNSTVVELAPADGDVVREQSINLPDADLGFAEVAIVNHTVLVAHGGNGGELLAAYGTAGLQQTWKETDPPAQSIFDQPTLAVDAARERVVVGGGLGGAAGVEAFSIEDGEEVWQTAWSAPGDVQGLALGPDGQRLLATGWVYEDAVVDDSHRIRVQMLDVRDGEESWMRGNTIQYHEEGKAAAFGPEGEQVYAAGMRQDDQNHASQDAHVRALGVSGPSVGVNAPPR